MIHARSWHVVRLMAVALCVFLVAGPAWACPTCKAALGAHDPAQGDLVRAYMWSILFLMAMPFSCLTLFSGYMYLLVRKARAAGEQAAAASASAAPTVAELHGEVVEV